MSAKEALMTANKVEAFDHAVHTAQVWVSAVANEFDTDDLHFAYRVLRAWLHTLRDRLTVEASAQFAAQLPELLRGVYYDGWEPRRVPVKYGVDEYQRRFAAEAIISPPEVRRVAAKVTAAVDNLVSPGQLTHVLAQLPHTLRPLLTGPDDAGR
jgi:uncharacterized protein (DUF2267 family)